MTARRILVIEDDSTFANALAELIRHCGHEAIIAGRGDIGLVLARQQRPDAIVLDVQLPGIDGWVLLDRLKHDPATGSVPVCVLTGDPRRSRALRLGAFAFLQKPVANDVFAAVLREIDEFVGRAEGRVAVIDDDARRAVEIAATIGGEQVAAAVFASAEAFVSSVEDPFDCCVIGTGAEAVEAPALTAIARSLPPRGVPILVRANLETSAQCIADLRRHAPEALVTPWHSMDALAALVAQALHRGSPGGPRRATGRVPFDPVLAGKRVLVIDDDARNILALTGLAERNRMDVTAARSGAEALDALRTARPIDLVLSDIMMPEMDGFATIRAVRELPRYARTPIVAVTAKALKGDREACLAAGASDFVAKPIDADQLFSVMRVLLAG